MNASHPLAAVNRPTADVLHPYLRELQRKINSSDVLIHVELDEEQVRREMAELGLVPLRKIHSKGAFDVDYGLHPSATHTEETFFHVCFRVSTAGRRKTVYTALYSTIYTNQHARGGWPIDPATGMVTIPMANGEVMEVHSDTLKRTEQL